MEFIRKDFIKGLRLNSIRPYDILIRCSMFDVGCSSFNLFDVHLFTIHFIKEGVGLAAIEKPLDPFTVIKEIEKICRKQAKSS